MHTYFHNHPTVEWSDNLSWAEAHDWVYQTMHLRDISTSNNADTGACLGNNGYYKIAKDAYSALGSAVQSQMQYIDDFGNAKARLSAWAAANGETASWSGSTLSISSARTFLMPTANVEKTNTIAIIVIISLVSVTAIGGYFFIKRRQEN